MAKSDETVEQAKSPEKLSLSTLSPRQPRKARKRVGRGLGSGKGRYSGRGIKGQKARAGSHTMRAGFEGGQMPLYMRLGKLRGSHKRMSMPVGPFRTSTAPVNVGDLEQRFEPGEEVTLELLLSRGLVRNLRTDVKILGRGEITKALRVTAHSFSRSAVEKIEGAGGSVTALRPPKRRRVRPERLQAKPADSQSSDSE